MTSHGLVKSYSDIHRQFANKGVVTRAHNHNICMDDALLQAEIRCAERGSKLTPLRKDVLKLVWQSHRPAKAYDILHKINKGNAKPPTVYRALDFLQREGLVHKLDSLNAYVGCAHPGKAHQCFFLICDRCNTISECCDTSLAERIEASAEKQRFTLKQVVLEMHGLCADCAEAETKVSV